MIIARDEREVICGFHLYARLETTSCGQIESAYDVIMIIERRACGFYLYARLETTFCGHWSALRVTNLIKESCHANINLSEMGTFEWWISGLMLDFLLLNLKFGDSDGPNLCRVKK